MKEYAFNFTDAKGKFFQAKFNDILFDYFAYREFLSQNVCLEILNSIKKISQKKVAVIYGNCQTGKVLDFLMGNKTFSEKYFVVKIPMVCEYLANKMVHYFQENFWSLCDLFISQRVSKDNRFSPLLATQKLPLLLPEDAKIIWIPNVYFSGYFPQYVRNSHNVGKEIHQSGFFPYGDKYVDAFLKGGGA